MSDAERSEAKEIIGDGPNDELTDEQKKCADETGHDFEGMVPEWDVGFHGHGRCKHCGVYVPYEPDEYSEDYL